MMKTQKAISATALSIMLVFGLTACGSSGGSHSNHNNGNSYTIGGIVNGLAGSGLVLQNNTADDLSIDIDGSFIFNTPMADGSDFAVTVLNQPIGPNQTCTVNGGAGKVKGSDVADVTVTCSTNAYAVGGTASGISGSVVLRNNGGDDLTLTTDDPFTFPTPVADMAGYEVSIYSSTGQICTIANETGIINGADVTDVILSCDPVSDSVSALYPTNGADWNDYVADDGSDMFMASDGACDPDIDSACLHGGEIRFIVVHDKYSCDCLTASDSLGAFQWTCDESTSPVRMISTGLTDGKNLSDLLDFAAPGWKDNSVTVYDEAVPYHTTDPAAWWANPVVVDNDGGYLDSAGTIYIVTNDDLGLSGEGYIINAPSVGFVGQPGLIINGPANGPASHVISADGTVDARDFLWIEGNVDAAGDGVGVYLKHVSFSMLRNVTSENADAGTTWDTGIIVDTFSNNRLFLITASNNAAFGMFLYHSYYNSFDGVTISNNGRDGIYIVSSSYNSFSDVTTSNNFGNGVFLESGSRNNMLSRVTVSNNETSGVLLNSSSSNTFSGLTVSSNKFYGVIMYSSSSGNTFSGAAATNNGDNGFFLSDSSNNRFSGVAISNNGSSGLYLNSSSNNYFTGPLKVGNNGADDCLVSGGTDPGVSNVTCANQGASDSTLTSGVTLATSFIGNVTADDTVNASDTDGAATYPLETASFDWSHFDNPFRGWGVDETFGDAGSRGHFGCSGAHYDNQTDCESNGFTWNDAGRIWDWSVLSDDAVIKDALALPTGNDTLTHIWNGLAADQSDCDALVPGSVIVTDHCETTFLRNAVEIHGDSVGNDNTLCESGETCLYTPNIASYQGHDTLGDAGYIGFGGTIEDVTLKQYDTNGY
jgi:parallel beta-helix repeat protein